MLKDYTSVINNYYSLYMQFAVLHPIWILSLIPVLNNAHCSHLETIRLHSANLVRLACLYCIYQITMYYCSCV